MNATRPDMSSVAAGAPASATAESVSGGVLAMLRLEGVAAFLSAAALYAHAGYSWRIFLVFFLSPDLSMFAYFAGPRVGAAAYNLAHTYAAALALALAGFVGGGPIASSAGLIWIAHIGLDRALGFGLKYSSGFAHTHLGRIGRG